MKNNSSSLSTENKDFVLKKIRQMKDPYNMKRKTYENLLSKCDMDKTKLNRLIIEATSERVQGLVL